MGEGQSAVTGAVTWALQKIQAQLASLDLMQGSEGEGLVSFPQGVCGFYWGGHLSMSDMKHPDPGGKSCSKLRRFIMWGDGVVEQGNWGLPSTHPSLTRAFLLE